MVLVLGVDAFDELQADFREEGDPARGEGAEEVGALDWVRLMIMPLFRRSQDLSLE